MSRDCAVILYSRAGCHLCGHVADMLAAAGVAWREVDIDRDPALAARYGLVIPVVGVAGSGRELGFPFGPDDLSRFLEEVQTG